MSNTNDNSQYVWVAHGDDMKVETGSYQGFEDYVDSSADGRQQAPEWTQQTLEYVEHSQQVLNGRKHKRSRKPRRRAEARKAQATQALADFEAMYNSQQGGNSSRSRN